MTMILPAPICGDTEFFRAFARFEQVLKASGYFKQKPTKTRNGEVLYPDAEADWDRFSSRREITDLHIDPNITYLTQHPPWHEVIKDGALDYQEKQGPIQTTRELLIAVRRVRNNLFHGEKTTLGPNGCAPRAK